MHARTSSLGRGDRGGALPMRLLLAGLARLRCGSLRVQAPDGAVHEFAGDAPGPAAALRVLEPGRLLRLLARGDLGFAEAYMQGCWDTPDLPALLELGALNEAALGRLLRARPMARAGQWLLHALRRNSRAGSRRNIAYHYDLGNDFYRLWLDEGMTYSSALFGPGATTLDAAQAAKYRRLVDLLDLRPEHHVLEIGCGWGGFALAAVRASGCRVTGVTLSRAQLEHARARVAEAGLEDRIELRLQDYRDIRGSFDRIASIEMFEAVGEQYWPVFFRTLRQRLVPGGLAALQVITIGEEWFDGYRRNPDFIQRHIFPGGMLPSPERFEAEVIDAGLVQRERDFFAADYARTLALWDERVQAEERRIAALGFDERFRRMWRYYLAYCQAGFRTGRVDLMQTRLERPAE